MKYMTVLENLLAADKIIFCFIEIAVVSVVDPGWHPLLFTKDANWKHVKGLYTNPFVDK